MAREAKLSHDKKRRRALRGWRRSPGPNIEETGMARVADIAVQEKTGSQSSTPPELDDEPK